MGWLTGFIDRLLGDKDGGPVSAEEAEARRRALAADFHHFKLLLGANSKSLEIMTDIEDALRGRRVFGMSFIRAQCTAAVVSVYGIIKHLDGMAPGKYARLFERLEVIKADVAALIDPVGEEADVPLVVPLRDVDKSMADVVGSKMANVGEIKNRIGLPVVRGFAVTVRGYHEFMNHGELRKDIHLLLGSTDPESMSDRFELSGRIQEKIMLAPLPPGLERAILAEYDRLRAQEGGDVRVSLRSSALGEDAAGASFAGQFRSILNVDRDGLADAYREVVASMFSLPALTYRLNRGIREEDAAMCVGCMVMVDSEAGGVMYSRSPVNVRDDAVFINSTWGLPKMVVDGQGAPDRFAVTRGGPDGEGFAVRETRIPRKPQRYVCRAEEGVCLVEENDDRADEPSLTGEQAVELARMAVLLEEHYGSPQDIEWALSRDGRLFILQCRPLSQASNGRDAAEVSRDPAEYGEPLLTGGVTASPGVGFGPVHILERDADALDCPQGAVLVARFALPKWASLLGWAAALVTEQGAVTGHLANVAREFGVPALTAVPDAARALRKGQVVTVDADTGVVYPGAVEALARLVGERRNLMEGSPVFEVLREAAAHILPLNLLDPDDPEFRARNCRTLHDITRFCHEKSVQEMFALNMSREDQECGGYQLRYDGRPVQFWVVDLEDGFDVRPEGPFIDVEDIVSVPMLALWDGINAIPWQGPPKVNAKGLMTIFLEAATNPALNPAHGSKFSNRNYFMVSSDYCNLQSRFGFHFSTVEALVDAARPMRSYINFRFAGGAADFSRRRRRAVFIAGLLQEFGFYVDVRSDNLFARYEGMPQPRMCERLKMLGYLTMHTRQLDMIMADEAATQRHRARIMDDIRRIVPGLRHAGSAGSDLHIGGKGARPALRPEEAEE
ncbi:PEP/pyruvate-binding domain-containing protein [Desulfocurvus sp. DL9XJH121]